MRRQVKGTCLVEFIETNETQSPLISLTVSHWLRRVETEGGFGKRFYLERQAFPILLEELSHIPHSSG